MSIAAYITNLLSSTQRPDRPQRSGQSPYDIQTASSTTESRASTCSRPRGGVGALGDDSGDGFAHPFARPVGEVETAHSGTWVRLVEVACTSPSGFSGTSTTAVINVTGP